MFKVVSLFLLKGVSLCEEYNIDAESFVEQWMAFSLNHLNGASPDLENLDVFARREFSKRAPNRPNAAAKDIGAGAGLAVYGAPVSAQYPFLFKFHVLLFHHEIVSSYEPTLLRKTLHDCCRELKASLPQ